MSNFWIVPLLHSVSDMTFNRSQYGHHFVSANHKTHYALSLSLNIINSLQWRQRQLDRHLDVVTLSKHYGGTPGMSNNLLDGIQYCHFHCFILHVSYIIGVQHSTILLWKSFTLSVWSDKEISPGTCHLVTRYPILCFLHRALWYNYTTQTNEIHSFV